MFFMDGRIWSQRNKIFKTSYTFAVSNETQRCQCNKEYIYFRKHILDQYQQHTNERIETVRNLGTVHFLLLFLICVIEKSIDIIPFPNTKICQRCNRNLSDRWVSQKGHVETWHTIFRKGYFSLTLSRIRGGPTHMND